MAGGAGTDFLYGGSGNDTYRFGRGGGQDYVSQNDTGVGKIDAITFDNNVLPGDVIARSDGTSLYLSIKGTTDRIKVESHFYQQSANNPYGIDEVRFVDGAGAVTTWNFAAIRAKAIEGSAENDTIHGYSDTGDVISALGGNDIVYGYAGNDTIDGGMGYDYIRGGDGSDVFLFNPGGGRDTIEQDDSSAGRFDSLQFGAGILASDVSVYRPANISNPAPYQEAPSPDYLGRDIVLVHEKTGEWVRLAYALVEEIGPGGTYIVPPRVDMNEVRFADGTVWTTAQLKQKAMLGHDWSESLRGLDGDDVLDGLAGDDVMIGRLGNDTLRGGAGNDNIDGEEGNDILEGGYGNDVLKGQTGNDIFRFSPGFGFDTIY